MRHARSDRTGRRSARRPSTRRWTRRAFGPRVNALTVGGRTGAADKREAQKLLTEHLAIMIMWDSPGEEANVCLMAAVDDQHWPAWLLPMSDSVIVAPNGS
jgi:hypothetical protein